MTTITHVATGLLLGKLTGNYAASILGATIIDLDHIFSLVKHKQLSPKKMLGAMTSREDPHGDQRNIAHNVFVWMGFFLLLLIAKNQSLIVFGLGYLIHLFGDLLDASDYYPFYPNKKYKITGPIKYLSVGELFLTIVLLLVFVVI